MVPFDLQGRTDRLETILEAVKQSQQTGMMNVQRGKGGVSEKGSISFLYGEAVDAEVGEKKGVEAWNWLKTWNSCQYVFTPKAPNEISIAPPSAPGTASSQHKITSPLAFVAQLLPKGISSDTLRSDSDIVRSDSLVTPVEASPANLVEQLPFTPVEPMPTTNPIYTTPPSLPSFPPPSYNPPSYNPVTPMPPVPQEYHASPYTPPSARVPHRLLQGPEALAYLQRARLSRQHRHIFFLLDGQRTADDLTRLTGHHITDILRILADLERIGLIKQE